MSSPPNPLDVYRTYSYHHILAVADSTTTAGRLAEETILSRFDHPATKFAPQELQGGQYIVLINGTSDAQFFIKSVKWSSVLMPSVGSSTDTMITSVQTMATDGEMEIVEPQGINFINLLAQATRLMNVDPALITFILKTIFIGYKDDGSVSVISNVKPLLFSMVDIASTIDVYGSSYVLSFVGVVNGAGKLPHVNAIVNGLNFHVSGTLDNAMKQFEEKINSMYKAEYTALTTQTNCNMKLNPDEFKEVTYFIHLDKDYIGKQCGDYEDDRYKDSSGGKEGYVSNQGTMASIESMIEGIMNTSKYVVDQAKGPLPDGRFIFKIASDIKTEGGKYEVHFYIHQYKAVVIKAEELQTFTPPDGTGITFDYIFTGKNVDIVDFDIKMEFGLVFFQVLSTQGTTPTSAMHMLNYYNSDTFVKGIGNARVLSDTDKVITRPLFLGTTLETQAFRDTKMLGPSASYNAMLTRHAMIESLGVNLKIRGNPQLLADTTQTAGEISTFELSEGGESSVIIPPNGDAEVVDQLRQIMPSPHRVPAYVKVNIMAPNSWTGSSERSAEEVAATSDSDNDYAHNFWYRGWYFMLQIDNNFDEGNFTQELQLISLPTEEAEQEPKPECAEQLYNAVQAELEQTTGGSGKKPVPVQQSKLAQSEPVKQSSVSSISAKRKESIANSAGVPSRKKKFKI